MIGKGKAKGREVGWEVVAVIQVRGADGLDRGGESGDKWTYARDS